MAVQVNEPKVAPEQGTARMHIEKRFGADFALKLQCAVPPGITILFGPSGAGKTTVLECIAGLLQPDAGRIELAGRPLFDSAASVNVPVRRRRIGYVFQTLALFPHLSAEANIAYGLAPLPAAEREGRVSAVAECFRIGPLRRRLPRDLSGGERQRVALARALVTYPGMLLLDEPLSALDLPTKSLIVEDLRRWNADHRIPVLYVTHSRDEVYALGERVLVLEQGRVLAQGTPHEVLDAPRQQVLAQLAGFENILDATVTAARESYGTMTCRLAGSEVDLEVPLGRARPGAPVRIAIRAGDILVATAAPQGLSARNLLPGAIAALAQQDAVVLARVECGGVAFQVRLTPGARESLELHPGLPVWLVIKTHSCHLVA
jgi:molybdate transport system ATP-binding protein